jgi:serine/threonine protein kinase
MEDNQVKCIKGYDINLTKVLGRGSFGVVLEATSHALEEVVAIKMINKTRKYADMQSAWAISKENHF